MKNDALAADSAGAQNSKTMLGFWIYLMTDCVLFASLFATYAVLHGNTFGGPTSKELFDLPFVLIETLLLLTSSFTAGIALLALRAGKRTQVMAWFGVTFILGLIFLIMEITEFAHLAGEGNSWSRSAFLSAFFTLVGTHGLHIATGLFWMIVLLAQLMKKGITESVTRRLTLFGMFWHFLDIIWIFIFTIVYLMGVL
jgi:cytochrome o ubiquinol oxidase subunit 3